MPSSYIFKKVKNRKVIFGLFGALFLSFIVGVILVIKSGFVANNKPLQIAYTLHEFDPKTQAWKDSQAFFSNITNTKRKPIDVLSLPHTYSPNYKYLGRIGEKSISISPNKSQPEYKTIVSLANESDIFSVSGIYWSPDEKSIAYEVRIHKTQGNASDNTLKVDSEVKYYTIDIDGSNNMLLGSIKNYPGGSILGYDFNKKIVYFTETTFKEKRGKLLRAFDVTNNTKTTLKEFPEETTFQFSTDYSSVYYNTDTQSITKMELPSGKTSTYLSVSDISHSKEENLGWYFFSRDKSLLFIITGDQQRSYKYIYNTHSKQVDTSLTNPMYNSLSFSTVSPDNRYVFLVAEGRDYEGDTYEEMEKGISFYSGKACLWDIKEKKLIPFYNCVLKDEKFIDDKINTRVTIIRWIVEP